MPYCGIHDAFGHLVYVWLALVLLPLRRAKAAARDAAALLAGPVLFFRLALHKVRISQIGSIAKRDAFPN